MHILCRWHHYVYQRFPHSRRSEMADFLIIKPQGQRVVFMAATIQQQIAKELADLRFRQLDESPEIKLLDTAKTHGRINALLDELDKDRRAADAAPADWRTAPGWSALLGGV